MTRKHYSPEDDPCTCTEVELCDACKRTRERIARLYRALPSDELLEELTRPDTAA
jgi:hypothetical protein